MYKLINISPFRKRHDLKQFVYVLALKIVMVLDSKLNYGEKLEWFSFFYMENPSNRYVGFLTVTGLIDYDCPAG
jgi:hypothetical protein